MIQFDINDSQIESFDNCPTCGSKHLTLLSDVSLQGKAPFLSTALCDNCGHVFRAVRPTEAWFFNAFDERHTRQQAAGINPINPEVEADRYKRYEAIGKYLKSHFSTVKSVLDVGCGPGTGLQALNLLGFESTGIDADESRAKIAVENGLDVFIGAWRDYNSDEGFDMVSCIHSLEHFYEPSQFLKEIADRVKEGGYLYIEVPDTLDHVKDWNDSLYLAHISNFNQHSLALLAASAGWTPVDRVNPYAGTGLHEGHLVMIFKKDSSVSNQDVSRFSVASDYADRIKALYRRGYDREFPHHFIVEAINDLSLTYKRTHEVRRSVDANYLDREIKPVEGSALVV